MAKYRHELKYLCNVFQINEIQNKLQSVMRLDEHLNGDNKYIVRSIYFDDYMNSFFYSNEEGIDPRYKWRIRNYNTLNTQINLEKKIKANNMTHKDICCIQETDVDALLTGKGISNLWGRAELINEFLVEKTSSIMRPTLLCEYTRIPYVCNLGNVRVTIDCNICASKDYIRFFDKKIDKIAILPSGYHLLEIKYDDFLPDIIYEIISNAHLKETSFSKFYLGRKALKGEMYDIW